MNYKYSLPDSLVNEVARLRDFANGGTQISVKTKDGKVYHEIVVSAGRHVVAMRGYDDLPFSIDQIAEVFQTAEDANPSKKGDFRYWDKWKSTTQR